MCFWTECSLPIGSERLYIPHRQHAEPNQSTSIGTIFFRPVAQAANAWGPISNKEEVADSFQACSVCIMEYFHPQDVLI